MRYRELPRVKPGKDAHLPAFLVSLYEDGEVLLFSHGSFDIWCVYLATPTQSYDSNVNDEYPLILDEIVVSQITGTTTDFKGSFVEYAAVSFEYDAPEDVEYLQEIRNLANRYGKDRVWASFLELYECIPQQKGVSINRKMTRVVEKILNEYPAEPKLRFTLDCLLCAMIAENNRLRKFGSPYDTHLGKKIKALGVHQSIYEQDMSIRQVANYSKGMPWRSISNECKKRGINTPDM